VARSRTCFARSGRYAASPGLIIPDSYAKMTAWMRVAQAELGEHVADVRLGGVLADSSSTAVEAGPAR
jgi:hypothetical protein